LIGLHFPPSVLLPSLHEDDWLIGMMRDPTQRLLSAVMHALPAGSGRRRNFYHLGPGDAGDGAGPVCGDGSRAGRGPRAIGKFRNRLPTPHGIAFPTRECCARPALCPGAKMSSSRHPSTRVPFWSSSPIAWAFQPGALRRLNANEPAALAAHLPEINEAIDLINSINAPERELYDFVYQSFEELRGAGQRWRRPLSGLYAIFASFPPSPGNCTPLPARWSSVHLGCFAGSASKARL
jgi:hypothetical protein